MSFKKLSVVVPVYNEIDTIEQIVDAVSSANTGLDLEIVLVDDGSTDGTRDVIKKLEADRSDTVAHLHEENRGKGVALKTGFSIASGEIVLIQDADLEYDPMEYPKLLSPILEGRADVVFGSRFLGGGPHRVVYYWHYVGNKFLTMLSNFTTNLNLTDMEVCYKVFKKKVIDTLEIKEKRFGVEPEITAKVAKGRWVVYEVPISYYGRSYDEGKKIGWRDGVRAVYCIFKYRFAD